MKIISQDLKKNISLILNQLFLDVLKIRDDYIFLFVLFLGTFLRLIHLSQPIKGDETATFLSFLEPFNPLRVFVYVAPNNHVFHTILAKISTFLFGNSVVAIRLPSFLASIGVIIFVYAICKRLGQNGVFGAIFTSIWPYLIAFSSNSRGYSLFCLLSLILVYGYLVIRKTLNKSSLIIISLISALGIYTIPTFVMVVMAIYIFIFLDQYFIKNEKSSVLIKTNFLLFSYTIFFSIILYLPVFLLSPNGYQSVLNNKTINESLTLSSYINEFFPYIRRSIIENSQVLPNFYLYFTLIFFFIGMFYYFIDKKILGIIIFPLILISSFLVITLKLVFPPERTWIYFIPFFLIVVDNGISRVVINLKNYKKLFIKLFLVGYSLVLLNPFLTKNFIDIEGPAFPESALAVKYLESQRVIQNKDKLNVFYLSGDYNSLNYYNWFYNAKLSVNGHKIYTRKSIFDSLQYDLRRFLNSEFKSNRQKNDEINFFIVNKRRDFDRSVNFSYEDLVKNYSLEMKAGELEIFNAEIINSK